MNIGQLDQHCGKCVLVDYCGNPYGYCLCSDERFSDVKTEQYRKIAETCEVKTYEHCISCKDEKCWECEHEDVQKDFFCEQISKAVHEKIIYEKGGMAYQ